MKKVIKISAITLASLTVTAALTYGLITSANEPTETVLESEPFKDEPVEVNVPEVVLKEDIDETVENIFPDDMTELEMQDAIHYMTHGFIEADQKWGHLQVTEERVKRLLAVAEQQQDTYDHGELYVSILGYWNDGDFSNAVADHNSIWKLKGGNVGRATRLLNQVEIDEYNDRYFE